MVVEEDLGPQLLDGADATVKCTILSGFFDYFIQLVLAVASFSVLLVKRHLERPRRPWKVFVLDVSKQGGGFAVAHIGNLIQSQVMVDDASDPCQWYLVNIILDTTARLLLTYSLHKGVSYLIERFEWDRKGDLNSGEYGDPPDLVRWVKQLALWLGLVALSKVLMGGVILALQRPLEELGTIFIQPIAALNEPHVELLIVMVVVPVGMNAVQLWVQDSFLKVEGSIRIPALCWRCCGFTVLSRRPSRSSLPHPTPTPTPGGLHTPGRASPTTSSIPAQLEPGRHGSPSHTASPSSDISTPSSTKPLRYPVERAPSHTHAGTPPPRRPRGWLRTLFNSGTRSSLTRDRGNTRRAERREISV